jgi:hypothetical protein
MLIQKSENTNKMFKDKSESLDTDTEETNQNII